MYVSKRDILPTYLSQYTVVIMSYIVKSMRGMYVWLHFILIIMTTVFV